MRYDEQNDSLNALLYSGGLDSTFILQDLGAAYFDVFFYFTSGHDFNSTELNLIKSVLSDLGCIDRLVVLPLTARKQHYHYRYLEMLTSAAIKLTDTYPGRDFRIYAGWKQDDDYLDTSMNFVNKMEDILNYSGQCMFRLMTPLYHQTKRNYQHLVTLPYNTYSDPTIAHMKD